MPTPLLSPQAAAKAAASALAKHPGDAQLCALRALAVQRLGHSDEAVQVRRDECRGAVSR